MTRQGQEACGFMDNASALPTTPQALQPTQDQRTYHSLPKPDIFTRYRHIASGDVILAVLTRRRQPAMPPSITTPDALRLTIEPMADCGRYDSIRKVA